MTGLPLAGGCRLLAWSAVLLALAPEAAAQFRAESQAALANRYVWRGITRSSKWSVQPQAAVGWTRRGVAVDGGVWGAVELGDGDARDRSEMGVPGHGLAELDLWSAATVYDGATAISLGVIRYTFHGRASRGGMDKASNTTELWGAIDLRRQFLSPRLDVFWDVGRVRGIYMTASGALPVIAWPFPPYWMVYVEGEMGLDIGQDTHPGRPDSGYFDDTGFTHARLTIRLPLPKCAGVTPSLAYSAQVGFDAATRAGLRGDPTRGRLTHVVELRLAYVAGGSER